MTDRKDYKFFALAMMLTTCMATPALATESGFYLGLNFGQSTFDVDESEVEAALYDSEVAIDDSDTAWSLSFGYRFSPYIGLEASYMNTGEFTATSEYYASSGVGASATSSTITRTLTAATTGTSVAVVGAIPVGNFELNAKLGLLLATTDLEISDRTVSVQGSSTFSSTTANGESASSTETIFGFGMGYTLSDHFHARIDWTRVPEAGDADKTGQADVALITAGFQYRF